SSCSPAIETETPTSVQRSSGGSSSSCCARPSIEFGTGQGPRTARDLAGGKAGELNKQGHPGGERDPWGRPLDETVVLVLGDWRYQRTGYATTPGAELALATAARAREHSVRATHPRDRSSGMRTN